MITSNTNIHKEIALSPPSTLDSTVFQLNKDMYFCGGLLNKTSHSEFVEGIH